jgi:hypothetical protein
VSGHEGTASVVPRPWVQVEVALVNAEGRPTLWRYRHRDTGRVFWSSLAPGRMAAIRHRRRSGLVAV